MNVGFDIDDTITRCPAFFALIGRALIDAGHKVYIISYRQSREETARELEEWDIPYTELVLADGEDFMETDFYAWKADRCRELAIDILFEDMPEVINKLDESTVAFMPFDPFLGEVTYRDTERDEIAG